MWCETRQILDCGWWTTGRQERGRKHTPEGGRRLSTPYANYAVCCLWSGKSDWLLHEEAMLSFCKTSLVHDGYIKYEAKFPRVTSCIWETTEG